MCEMQPFAWLVHNANLLSGILGIVGSLLLAVPAWSGAALREQTLNLEKMRNQLTEPALLDPNILDSINKSLKFLRNERYWVRAGTLGLIVAFALILIDTSCK
jgi:hypothetical protein